MSIGFIFVVLSAWGVGSLVKTIGKIRGWRIHPTLAFWISAIAYFFSTNVIDYFLYYILGISEIVDYVVLIAIGILSITKNLALKRAHPKIFNKSFSNPVDTTSRYEKEQPVDLGDTQPFRRRAPEASAESKSDKSKANITASRIFISYRRSDSADVAGRIYDRLVGKFDRKMIFKDVDSIPLGLDFKEYLDKQVGECKVLLAVIGDRWLDASNASGKRRLEDPTDFVRIEIESALERGIPVVPLLVRGASMPGEENLPPSLRKLVYRNGIPIRPDPDFHRDMDRLIKALEEYVK